MIKLAQLGAVARFFGPLRLAYFGLFAASGYATLSRWLSDGGADPISKAVMVCAGMFFLIAATRGLILLQRQIVDRRWIAVMLTVPLVGLGIFWNGYTDWRWFESNAHSASADLRVAGRELTQVERDLGRVTADLAVIQSGSVVDVQRLLSARGYEIGRIDGQIGPRTQIASGEETERLLARQTELTQTKLKLDEASHSSVAEVMPFWMRVALVLGIELALIITPFALVTRDRKQEEVNFEAESDSVTRLTTAPAASIPDCPGNPEDYDLLVYGTGSQAKLSWKKKRRVVAAA